MIFPDTNSILALAAFFSLAISSSQAELSEACQSELIDLSNNADIVAINDAKVAFITLESESCANNGQAACNIDFNDGQFSDYESTCVAGGGQVFEVASTQSCMVNGVTLTINTMNEPLCVGQSCDENNVEEITDQAWDDIDQELEALGFDSCQSDSEVAGSDGSLSGAFRGPAGASAMLASTALIASALLVL